MTPEEMLGRLLYRDGLMLVIDKPAGFAVHRGPKGGESLDDHFGALRFGLPRAPALAHRLDRDTSGCLVLGRHRKALALLGKLFKQGKIGKTYWAVVEGAVDVDAGQIDIALGKLDESRGWWMKPDPHGQPAVTTWRVMGRSQASPRTLFTSSLEGEVGARSAAGGGSASKQDTPLPNPPPQGGREHAAASGKQLTWLALEPLTGRTHQLRVHCAEMGWPILGDNIYGRAPRNSVSLGGPPLHLHSREVVVPIFKNKPPVVTTAPVPAHMREALAACGWTGEASA
jgi:tRNA pseudouridine32 synthase/23S rRNA pseudouridine746 synthase